MKTICILGGGFAGLYTALRLQRLDWGEKQRKIILVDKSDRFIFTPLLYELLTGEMADWEIAPTFQDLLKNTDIEFRQGSVEEIDLPNRVVRLATGEPIDYSFLVLGLGGETPIDMTPGAAEYAIPFRNLEDVSRLEKLLRLLENSDREKIRVAVVGAGYSGIELACKLADRLGERSRMRVIELSDKILQRSPEFNRQAAIKALADREIWVDLETAVTEVTEDSISLKFREEIDAIPVDLVLWTVGNRVSPKVAALPLQRNSRGQLLTRPTLQTADRDEVYALGDLAEIIDGSGKTVPATAQSALQQADFAAWNIWATILEKPLLPFRYNDLGEMLTLGNNNATLSGLGLQLDGPMAYLARRLVYLYRLPTFDHQVQVGLSWIGQPFAQLLAKAGR
jgi:demethylphylloquinone reductase